MATGISLSKVRLTPLNWPILKNPYKVKVSGLYLLHSLSYTEFCVAIRKCWLPWQQGRSEQILTDTLILADRYNPLLGANIRSHLFCKLSYGHFCVENRKFSLPWQQGSV